MAGFEVIIEAPDQPLPFVRRGGPSFHHPALAGISAMSTSPAGRHEIELVGVAHQDSSLERVLQFRRKLRPGSLDSQQTRFMAVCGRAFKAKASRCCTPPLRRAVPTCKPM